MKNNDSKFKNNLVSFVMQITSKTWIIISFVLIITMIMIYFIRTRIRVDNDLTNYMNRKNPVRIRYEKYENVFGSSSGVIIALKGKSSFSKDVVQAVYELTDKINKVNNEILKNLLFSKVDLNKKHKKILFNFLLTEMGKSDFTLKNLKNTLTNEKLFASRLGISTKSADTGADSDDTDHEPDNSSNTQKKPQESVNKRSADTDDEEQEEKAQSLNHVRAIVKYFKNNKNKIEQVHKLFTIEVDKNGLYKSVWIDDIRSYTEVDYATGDFVDKTRFYKLFSKVDKKQIDLFLAYVLEFYTLDKKSLKMLVTDVNKFSKLTGISLKSAKGISQNFPYKKFIKRANDSLNLQIKSEDLVKITKNEKLTNSKLVLLKNRLLNWGFQKRLLYSKDKKSTLIIVRFVPNIHNAEIDRVFKFLKKDIKSVLKKKNIEIHMAGEPVLLNYMGKSVRKDMKRLIPFVIIIVIISLYISFRKIIGVVLPLITVLIVVLWTLGSMALSNTPISIISNLLPVVLIAVGTSYGIHIITHYFTDIHLGLNKDQAVKETISKIGLAVVLAALTTMAGFSSNIFNEMRPLKELGIFSTLGVFLAFILSVIFISTILRLGKNKKQSKTTYQNENKIKSRRVDNILEWIGKSTYKNRLIYIAVFIVVIFVAIYGAGKIVVDMDNLRFINKDTDIRKADKFLNSNFGGTTTLSVVIKVKDALYKKNKIEFEQLQKKFNENSISKQRYLQAEKKYNEIKAGALRPELLYKIDDFKKYLHRKSTYGSKYVGKVISIVDTVKRINQVFNFGNPAFYKTPATIELVNSYVTSFRSDETKNYLTKDRRKTRILIQIKESSSMFSKNFLDTCKRYLDKNINKNIYDVEYTGFTSIKVELNSIVIKGQAITLAFSLFLVFIIILVSYKKIYAAIIAILPLGMTVLFNFGVMGFFGIKLDTPTSVIGSIAIGIGIDDTIHYIHIYLSELKKGDDLLNVTINATRKSGRAIIFTTLSITLGFSVLLFSVFKPVFNTGLLVFITMWVATFCSITVIPAFLNVIYKAKQKKNVKLNK